MDTTKEFTAIEWCAGYGGIHLGLKRAISNLRVIAYSEIEGFSCANLVSKMEAGLLDAAPIWTDLKTFPCEEFRDRVGLLVAGYPCQPFSAAGKRLGAEDPRHLWPHIARAIRLIRPRLCFFENVEGHISLGLREVLGDLGAAGYTAAWGIFSASEVGAPHQRKRVFILAYDKSLGIQGCGAGWLQEPRPHAGQALPVRGGDAGGGELVNACHGSNPAHGYAEAHRLPSEHWQEICAGFSGGANATAWPSRPGEPQRAWEPPRVVANGNGRGQRECCEQDSSEISFNQQTPQRNNSGGCNEAMGHHNSPRPQERPRQRGAGIQGTDTDGGADAGGEIKSSMGDPVDGTKFGVGLSELSGLSDSELAEICEWMVKTDNRTDELRLLGNGVVPATAERAFRILMEQL